MKYCCSVMSKITDDHGFRSTHPSTWDKMAVNCVWYFSQQEMAKGHCRLEARFKPSLEGEGLAVPVTAECSLVGWLTWLLSALTVIFVPARTNGRPCVLISLALYFWFCATFFPPACRFREAKKWSAARTSRWDAWKVFDGRRKRRVIFRETFKYKFNTHRADRIPVSWRRVFARGRGITQFLLGYDTPLRSSVPRPKADFEKS